MKLYQGSNIVIDQIDLSKCKPYKDFGQGFYLTEIKEQAEQMARRTSAIYGGEPIVTEFEFDETALKTLSVKTFEEPSEDWPCSLWLIVAGRTCNRHIVLTLS